MIRSSPLSRGSVDSRTSWTTSECCAQGHIPRSEVHCPVFFLLSHVVYQASGILSKARMMIDLWLYAMWQPRIRSEPRSCGLCDRNHEQRTLLSKVEDIHNPPTSRANCDSIQIGLIPLISAVISCFHLAQLAFDKYTSIIL